MGRLINYKVLKALECTYTFRVTFSDFRRRSAVWVKISHVGRAGSEAWVKAVGMTPPEQVQQAWEGPQMLGWWTWNLSQRLQEVNLSEQMLQNPQHGFDLWSKLISGFVCSLLTQKNKVNIVLETMSQNSPFDFHQPHRLTCTCSWTCLKFSSFMRQSKRKPSAPQHQ